MEIQLGDVGHIIQLSIAPVFLLTGVGTKLMVLITRLGRIIDRSRTLEDRHSSVNDEDRAVDLKELDSLYRRAHLINRAITLSTACGLLICVLIVTLFLGAAMNLSLAEFIAALFIFAMFSLIGSFMCLLREIFVATTTLSLRSVDTEV